MENASKALIIAGAILLSIAIIGIGMYVYNMAAGTIEGANMSQQQVTAYNSEFTKYEGVHTGATVKTLFDSVISHNTANSDDTSKQIAIKNTVAAAGTTSGTACTGLTDIADTNAGTPSATLTTYKGYIKSGYKYRVAFNYTKSGMIKEFSVVKQ